MSIPDALSYSRIPLGIVVAFAAAMHHWGLALIVLLVALATDVLDGYVAKRQNSGTKRGAEILEPVCDLAMTVGALVGLLVAHRIGWTEIIVLAAVGAVVQVINSFFTTTVLFTKFGVWFMPCYFLIIIWIATMQYAEAALTTTALGFFFVAAVGVSVLLIIMKRHRFAAWFRGELSYT